jgi:thiol-disulfide isomerase/thioredoxin
MKKIRKILRILRKNFFFFFIIGLLIYKQGPIIENNLRNEGKVIPQQAIKLIPSDTEIKFPPEGKAVAIFWSSTCPPCILEMIRLDKSVKAGRIPKDKIFALNTYESDTLIKKYQAKKKQDFQFAQGAKLAHELNILGTPTTVLLNNGKLEKISTGASFIGIWQIENFFK